MELYSRVELTSDMQAVLESCGQSLRFLFKNPRVELFVLFRSYLLGVFHANQISMCLDPHLN